MDFDLVYNDEPLTIRADVKNDSIQLIDGETKTEFSIFSLDQSTYLVKVNSRIYRLAAVKEGNAVFVSTPGGDFRFALAPTGDNDSFSGESGVHGDKSRIFPPMPGKVVKVLVTAGQKVRPKEKLVIVEAMKMENPLVAPYDAEVVKVNCTEGQLVDTEDLLVELKKAE
jgi:biotin carboxyl carrier protein